MKLFLIYVPLLSSFLVFVVRYFDVEFLSVGVFVYIAY